MSAHRASPLALALILACAAAASPARAAALSQSQVRSLAAQAAAGDQLALGQLRTVTSIAGRPADLAGALSTRNPSELQARLLVLASAPGPTATTSPNAARQSAQSILAAQQFHGAPVVDPIDSALQKLGSWIGRLAGGTPGGPPVFWAVAGAAVLLLAVAGARRTMRRLEVTQGPRSLAGATAAEDPAELDREAAAAENRGAYTDAVRLRFRAGLLRVSGADYRASMRNGELSKRLGSAQFDVLAHNFDRIVYGGAAASQPDAEAARQGWERVLTESGRR